MSEYKMFFVMFVVAVICGTGLISQCSYNVKECQQEAIKSSRSAEEIVKLCKM